MKADSFEGISRRAPLSTYRLQFNGEFNFADATEVVPYLADLGATDVYASPYLMARAGSPHGYDISDHNQLNPELGGAEAHEALVDAIQAHGLGHLLDIVPNHMGIGEPSNTWWMDVLENGPSSPFAQNFDIDWSPLQPHLQGKVLLPVLGGPFGVILEAGELKLVFESGRFRIHYFDHIFPVAPKAAVRVLRAVLTRLTVGTEGEEYAYSEVESVLRSLEHLPDRDRTDLESIAERRREGFVARRRLDALYESSDTFRAALEAAIALYNGRPGEPRSFDDLEELLNDQAYRLAYWRVAAEEINYRRFFDINDLAGVRVERADVFAATHRLVLRLVEEGKVTSLRIDHPDGLFDPGAYLDRLQTECSRRLDGEPVYVLVEKILTGEESLPEGWAVAGTVGYDFLNRANGLFVAGANALEMTRVYEDFIGRRVDFPALAYENKRLILRVALASELNVLSHFLDRISEKSRRNRDFTLGALRNGLRETIACFPVYRTYIDPYAGRVSDADAANIERAIRAAVRRNRATSPTIFEFIRSILLLHWPEDLDDDSREEHARFVMKFQQLTGPVMAKGVEDTSFYVYNRLLSLNEVGGEPEVFGIAPEALHRWLQERAVQWPMAMNASSTHDTKRSEDVRARINVLSEMPEEWRDRVRRWSELNAPRKGYVDGDPVPDANDEYLLYQTLVGVWPLGTIGEGDGDRLRERVQLYMEKATREAKVHTSWVNPNEAYEQELQQFIARILDFGSRRQTDGGFLADLTSFHEGVARYGMFNSLGQTLLKLTCPGVPDHYQGQESWDFSLVDPDNRRRVDFDARRYELESLRARLEELEEEGRGELAAELYGSWWDGRIKLFVTHLALRLRRSEPDLFRTGEYLPLEPLGQRRDHVFGFARVQGERVVVTVVPRLPFILERDAGASLSDPATWGDTRLTGLPESIGGEYRNLFTGEEVRTVAWGGALAVGPALSAFPVALLERV